MTASLTVADDLDALIRRDVAEVTEAVTTAVVAARRLGRRLAIMKGRLQHGEWLPYLQSIGLPARTAQDYMRIAKSAGSAYLTTIEGSLKHERRPARERRMEETMQAWPGLKAHMVEANVKTLVEAYVRLTAPVFYGVRKDWPTKDEMAWVFGVERLFERDYRTAAA